jgi:hypothetical protein
VVVSLRETTGPHAEREDNEGRLKTCPTTSETEFGLMAASKSKSSRSLASAAGFVGLLLRPQNRGIVLAGLVVAAAISSALYAWRRWGEPSMQSPDYVVTPERIMLNPQPAWIHSNVKADVVRSAKLSRLNLRDRRLVQQIAEAFALHPWVAKVTRVEKRFPAQVNVELEYRRPVLVVKLDMADEKGLLFLDEEGVLLPTGDFAAGQARDYLRIMAAGETPAGVYGTPWGSERLAAAARLAAAWENRWQPLGLYWIVAARGRSGNLAFELRTLDDKVRVVWGAVSGHESASEPTTRQKIAALEQYVHDKGPLDKAAAGTTIDLAQLAGSAEKTARANRVPGVER